MLHCSEFLDDYSGLRDGSLDAARESALRGHAASCPSCARYDHVISAGVEVFRELPEIEPSYDFLPRLQHRIYQLDYEASVRRRRASGASTLLTGCIALGIAAALFTSLVRTAPAVVELPPIEAHAPHRVEPIQVLFRSGPLLTRDQGILHSTRSSLFNEHSPLGSFASTSLRAP